ncbi:MAG: anti-sigma factor [bacterium]
MSFSCRDIQDRWSEYLYRELDEPEQAKFVQHIRKCRECSAEEAQWRGLLSRFDVMAVSDGNMEPPPELVFRVKRQIRLYEDWTRQTVTQVRNWVLGAAAAWALLLGGAHIILNQIPDLNEPATALKPIAQSVLSNLYNEHTLEILTAEGIFEQPKTSDPDLVAQAPHNQDTDFIDKR